MLGKGGFARVYKAVSKHTRAEVAIKKVCKKEKLSNTNIGRSRQCRGKWMFIACTTRSRNSLKHGTRINCYDAPLFLRSKIYLHCYGSLRRWRFSKNVEVRTTVKYNNNSAKKTVSEEQCRKYTRQIVNAMIYLQSMGVIHRDLKLSNILLTKDDNIVRIS
jgi:serine/threonine protein kinase